jgi:hypothetical protein
MPDRRGPIAADPRRRHRAGDRGVPLIPDQVEQPDLAGGLLSAALETLRDGVRSRGLGGAASTEAFASTIINRLTGRDA